LKSLSLPSFNVIVVRKMSGSTMMPPLLNTPPPEWLYPL
jgi:hypothetical protein